jgi:hypothetical protein
MSHTDVIKNLKALYTTPSPRRAAREATLAPIIAKAHALREDLTVIVLAHADLSHAAATLDLRALGRYLRLDLVPVVARARQVASEIVNAGTLNELVEALYTAEAKVDAVSDRDWEAAMEIVNRLVERAEGSVKGLRIAADALLASLTAGAAEPVLASATVNVPKLDVTFIAEKAKA